MKYIIRTIFIVLLALPMAVQANQPMRVFNHSSEPIFVNARNGGFKNIDPNRNFTFNVIHGFNSYIVKEFANNKKGKTIGRIFLKNPVVGASSGGSASGRIHVNKVWNWGFNVIVTN